LPFIGKDDFGIVLLNEISAVDGIVCWSNNPDSDNTNRGENGRN
jgi:hypothetical protein